MRTRQKVLAAVAGLGVTMTGIGALGASRAEAATWQCERSVGTSFSGKLYPGQCITSSNRAFRVTMQRDGNLVLRRTSGGAACWASSWQHGWYRAGDYAQFYVKVTRVGYPTFYQYGMQVRNARYYTYSAFWGKAMRPQPLNASVNTSGQFWIGFQRVGSC
ncbi:hypothetical protein [Calidifontibacter indicus]|uniref:hypothetical protein n=1 Tax=Calidifontibacter indicus TaxID=419650 RepID=UPI003D7398D2